MATWIGLLTIIIASSSTQAAVVSDVRVAQDRPDLGVIAGVVKCDEGTTYNGSRPIDVVRGVYLWRISGRGFGTPAGNVLVLGRSVTIISWSDTQIVIDPWTPSPQWPVCGLVAVYPRAGSSGSFALNIVPACWGTIYGQCTFWVSYRRWQAGLSPASYASPRPLDRNWVPQALDYCIFNGNLHVALVESASRRLDGTFDLGMSDYNADMRNSGPRYFTTQFNPARGIVPTANQSGTLRATGWKR